MIPLFKVYMCQEAVDVAVEVLRSGWVGEGPKVLEFEKKLKDFVGTENLLTVNTCTSALHLALHMIGVGYQDEVISTPLTCFATNAPVLHQKANILWADVDPATCNISIPDVVSKVSEKTKAIMVVHWGGIPVDVNQLKDEVIKKLGSCPPIIEDCAHAMGALYSDGSMVGTSGNWCCFSFQAIKNLTSVDGGALVCPADQVKRGKTLRWYGINRDLTACDCRSELPVEEPGYKYNMNDLCASIGGVQLQYLPKILETTRSNALYYMKELENLNVKLSQVPQGSNPSWWLFTLLVDKRDDFISAMKSRGVMTSKVHQRNDTHPCVNKFKVDLPLLDSFTDNIVCIPVGWWVSPFSRQHIVEAIKKGW